MNIAILLHGHTLEPQSPSPDNLPLGIDWKLTRENIRKQLLSSFGNSDIYLSSYRSIDDPLLVDYFQPSAYQFFNTEFSGGCDLDCLMDGLRLVQHSRKRYDGVLVSRFDLHFYSPVIEINFDFSKINFLYREFGTESFRIQGKCCNGLWYIPLKFIDTFIMSCRLVSQLGAEDVSNLKVLENGLPIPVDLTQRSHYIYFVLRNYTPPEQIHFTSEEYLISRGARHKCPYYKVVRSPHDIPEISLSELSLLGAFFYSVRNSRAQSHDQVEAVSGISAGRLAKIELGECNLTVVELKAVCSALDVEPARVLRWVASQKPLF